MQLYSVAPTPQGTGVSAVPPILQTARHGGTVSRKTANKNWQNCSDAHESAPQND